MAQRSAERNEPPSEGGLPHAATPSGYLDAASGLPLHPAGRAALLEALDQGWADPARRFHDARRARLLLDAARESVAGVLGARPDEISFTTSGTQAVHLAVTGLAQGRARAGRRVLASAVEHSSVLHAARSLPGEVLESVPVDSLGRLDVEELRALLADGDVALVAVQSANHEVGTRQPVAAAAEATEWYGVPLVVDAAQSLGRDDVPDAWSVLTASAHKWGGPAGVGVLAVRTGVRWRSPLPDGARAPDVVPGFPDVPSVVAAAVALEAMEAERAAESARLASLVDRIRARVPEVVPDVVVIGDPDDRLPHLVTFSCLYVEGEALLADLDRAGFAVSSGSSCVADALVPSHVLAAMGVLTHGNLRVSLPPGCPESDVERFLDVLPGVVASVRAELGTEGL
ncbi:MAG TPA: aminotransferase class V-fold PLP-dependent enzyme [Candidatus Nanopelagicales bacterium]|nr:aminotransferase class V-fold PLP-dependent enzyme [Candidatus Nanopelagicales bacterium]